MNKQTKLTTALAATLTASAIALAQTGGPFDLSWYTIDSGGVVNASAGPFTLSGTVGQGQDAAEPLTGGPFTLRGGFWAFTRDTATPCPGDTNNDQTVGLDDLLTVLANFGNNTTNGPTDGDIDPPTAPDGTVGLGDLLLLLANFGNTCP